MSDAYCGDVEGWGPTSPNRVDLTPCFQSTILHTIPSLVAVVVFSLRSAALFRKQQARRNNRVVVERIRGWFLWTGIAAWAVCAAVMLARAILLSRDHNNSSGSNSGVPPSFPFSASLSATISALVAWVLACVLTYLESLHSIRSSDLIFAYAMINMLTTSIYLRTLHDIGRAARPEFAALCVYLVSLVIGFVTEAWPRGRAALTTKGLPATAYDTANLFSRVIFHYMQPIITTGYRRPLQQTDLDNIMPSTMLTAISYSKVSAVWRHHVVKHPKNPSLIKVIIKWGGIGWLPMILAALLQCTFSYFNPLLLGELIAFVDSFTGEGTGRPVSLGLVLAFALFFSTILATAADGQTFQLAINMGSELRTGLISMIYRKALVLSPGARQSMTVGEITNRMAVDCERIATAIKYAPFGLIMPVELAVGIWLLYNRLGWCAIVGVGVLVLTSPAQGLLGKIMNKAKDRKLEAMDSRIRLMNEILGGIKITKLYGWEDSFRERITSIRNKELKENRKIGTATAFMMIMFTSLPNLMTMVSLVVYALAGGPGFTRGVITAEKIFVTVSLFNKLSMPIGRLSLVITQSISLNVAAKRIQEYLIAEEMDSSAVTHRRVGPAEDSLDERDRSHDSGPSITIHEGTFAWAPEDGLESTVQVSPKNKKQNMDKEKNSKDENEGTQTPPSTNPILVDINLTVSRGSLTVIVGRVGQGKSSLIAALMGEMYKRKGSVVVEGSIGYVPQQAWIFNATLKENIVFGMPFDQDKYDKIVYSCGLKPDFDMLPAGDQTEIGERGINLSGGQKQRVSLARAAYQDADIYLLDDPLSAVDAHVDQHLWENLIGPNGMLKDKTRLLVTHGIHHLSEADQIVVLKDGKINEVGQYQDLMAAKGAFFQLIEEYSVKAKDAAEGDTSKTNSDQGGIDVTISDLDDSKEGSSHISNHTMTDNTHNGHSEEVKNTQTAKGPQTDNDDDENARLIQEEEMMTGNVGWRVVSTYVKACTPFYATLSCIGFIFSQACQLGASKWLEHWSASEDRSTNVDLYLGVYGALIAGYIFFDVFVNWCVFALAGITASRVLHENLLTKVLTLPMSFFDTTPTGRILNRFSSDIDNMDELLPFHTSDFYFFVTTVLGTLVIISISMPIFIAFIPVIVVVYAFVQTYYMHASRSLKRLASVAKSPMYSHFSETLTGVTSIRAMNVGQRFIDTNASHSDKSANAMFTYATATRWLHSRLELLGAFAVLAVGLLSVLGRKSLGGGIAGLALSYALNITWQTSYLVEAFCELLNQLVSVERIKTYAELISEAPHDLPSDKNLPDQWPQQGHIEFKNYSTRYREGLELVVKSISFKVQPGEKIGIVGRTGAGKSSLTLALFRIIEAANNPYAKAAAVNYNFENKLGGNNAKDGKDRGLEQSQKEDYGHEKPIELEAVVEEDGGSIWIDGIDIATVGLNFLRQHLAIIPQDPTLFAGSLRENLDPFGEKQDADLWEALERAHLKDYVSTLPGGLSHEVAQNGENFSVGQRSLICLARALLRKSKILVLDEATSSVDMQTDELIQKTIRTEFQDRTILTIAHRIKTVMDYDKILVLDKGRICEYEPPKVLLQNKDSFFYKLAKQAGEVAA